MTYHFFRILFKKNNINIIFSFSIFNNLSECARGFRFARLRRGKLEPALTSFAFTKPHRREFGVNPQFSRLSGFVRNPTREGLLLPDPILGSNPKFFSSNILLSMFNFSRSQLRDSNPRPTVYKTVALPLS